MSRYMEWLLVGSGRPCDFLRSVQTNRQTHRRTRTTPRVKNGHSTLAHNLAVFDRFWRFFHPRLSSDCVRNWSLKIPLTINESLHYVHGESLVFKTWSNQHAWGVIESLMMTSLQVYCRIRRWKSFENRSTFGKRKQLGCRVVFWLAV